VVDLALGHVAALKAVFARKGQSWYDYINLGSGVGYSVLEVVRAYSKALGRELPYKLADRRPGDVAILTANPQKARDVLQW
jgi:UDP-glucose 4-epimerase